MRVGPRSGGALRWRDAFSSVAGTGVRPEGDHVLQRAYNLKYRINSLWVWAGYLSGGLRTKACGLRPETGRSSPPRTAYCSTVRRQVAAHLAGYIPLSLQQSLRRPRTLSPGVFRRSRYEVASPLAASPRRPSLAPYAGYFSYHSTESILASGTTAPPPRTPGRSRLGNRPRVMRALPTAHRLAEAPS